MNYQQTLRMMLLPYLIGALLLVGFPALLSFGLSFTSFDALSTPAWSNLDNFHNLFYVDDVFPRAVVNSLIFMLTAVPLRIGGALLLAMLLNLPRRGVGFYRLAVFLPTIIPDVAYALIWLYILNPMYGPLNKILAIFGINGPAWLVDTHTALPALVLMSLFQIGEGFVLLLAGLNSISSDLYRAAAVDGGNRWQIFRLITLPLLQPWLLLLTFRDVILTTQNTFVPAFIMTGGGPYYATTFMPLHIYEEAFDRFRFGLGSAMMLLLFTAVAIILLFIYLVFQGWGFSDEV